MSDAGIIGIELDFTIISGSSLVAKDGGGFFKLGKATTSDPYVVVRLGKAEICTSQVASKTLNPEWNETFKQEFMGRKFNAKDDLVFTIYDRDRGSKDDPMGEVRLPITSLFDGHVTEKAHEVTNCAGCKDASGTLKLSVSCAVRRPVTMDKGGQMTLGSGILAVGLGWDMLRGNTAIDLDTSCVALSFDGRVLQEECVYFAQLRSKSGAIHHTGDEREGDEDLGQVGASPCISPCISPHHLPLPRPPPPSLTHISSPASMHARVMMRSSSSTRTGCRPMCARSTSSRPLRVPTAPSPTSSRRVCDSSTGRAAPKSAGTCPR